MVAIDHPPQWVVLRTAKFAAPPDLWHAEITDPDTIGLLLLRKKAIMPINFMEFTWRYVNCGGLQSAPYVEELRV